MATPTSEPRRLFSVSFIVMSCVLVVAAMVWRWTRDYPLPLFDLYPLYYGGKAWLQTGNGYDLAPVTPLFHQRFTVFKVGNGYPLPAMLLTLPLTLLPPQIAATVWIGGLLAALLVLLRLHRAPFWLLLYVPVLEALRIEQYTMFILVLQLLALLALRQQRTTLLAVCCALILTKPTHGAVFVVFLMLMAQPRRQFFTAFAVAMGIVWGGTTLLDPGWVGEWLGAVRVYAHMAAHPTLWWLVPLALPLLYSRQYLSAALVVQLSIFPHPGVYAACALPLGVLHDQRSRWLSVISFLWPAVAVGVSKSSATAVILVVPLVVLALLQQRFPPRETSEEAAPPEEEWSQAGAH